MDDKLEQIIKRIDKLESIQNAILDAIITSKFVDSSKLPDQLEEKLIIKKHVKEKMDDINLMNEWIEKDKQEIIKYYGNKPLTTSEKNDAINRYCIIGTAQWWYPKKSELDRLRNANSQNIGEDTLNDLRRQETITIEQHQGRRRDIIKERKNEIDTKNLFE